ncbi:SGNH hydrolase [Venustampulla echinocandica]|uniref:SGNH hydrolase n=1 Tax=Venustampulla echinocandica TaxID=2656787 RepID=A0A370TZ25_9HELO|nr:SGNH hydrolase [Venustampulla echinocandica]RDL40777.1 SGNH hydrolase [Venustampulla echinocandica]
MAFRMNVFFLATCLLAVFQGIDGRRHNSDRWIPTWGTMPQLTEPGNLPSAPFNETGQVFFNSTIRQTIHTSIGGSKIRLRFSNAFGITDLPITSVTVALPVNGSAGIKEIQAHTLKTVTFSGSANYTVPQGGLVVSDPIDFPVKPESILTVTLYLSGGQQTNMITSHPGSRTTSWWTFGNQVKEAALSGESLANAAHWYFLSNVEVTASKEASTFVIVGDSITDGRGSDNDQNNRWPDRLLSRMQKRGSTSNIAVVNQAAGGNRILNDGLGPNAIARLDRDVFAQAGVEYAMIFSGVNDIGTESVSPAAQKNLGDRLIAAYSQMATRLKTFDITIFAATITPFSAAPGNETIQPYSDKEREKTRQRVNKWIRESGTFDDVMDFDAWLRDPAHVDRLNPLYDGGDYLHPNGKGYQRIADLFPLDSF